MTDQEREAQTILNDPRNFNNKRCGHNFPIEECPYKFCDAKENKRLLDEARAETRLAEADHDASKLRIEQLEAEIAGLRRAGATGLD